MSGVRWDKERDAELRRLYIDQGFPASVVAVEMGSTRNAILGRAYRIGLSRHDRPEIALANSRRARHNQLRGAAYHSVASKPRKPQPPTPPARPLPPPIVAKPLLALSRWECRNPVGDLVGGDTLFCATPTKPGRFYCEACTQLLFRPTSPKERKELQRVAAL